jgi:uncharacterized membrane protein HdeD (DUF308 family)
MSVRAVRSLLAISVVGTFMVITGFMAIFPLVSKQNVEITIYSDFFLKTASVYSGIVGVIVGYYFGRAEDARNDTSSLKRTKDEDKKEPVSPTG